MPTVYQQFVCMYLLDNLYKDVFKFHRQFNLQTKSWERNITNQWNKNSTVELLVVYCQTSGTRIVLLNCSWYIAKPWNKNSTVELLVVYCQTSGIRIVLLNCSWYIAQNILYNAQTRNHWKVKIYYQKEKIKLLTIKVS